MARMTRDFELQFKTHLEAKMAQNDFSNIKLDRDGGAVFGDFEIKGSSLFLSLVYPEEILAGDFVITKIGERIDIAQEVVFVAIKNGMHHARGYCFSSKDLSISIPDTSVHVRELNRVVKQVFSKPSR